MHRRAAHGSGGTRVRSPRRLERDNARESLSSSARDSPEESEYSTVSQIRKTPERDRSACSERRGSGGRKLWGKAHKDKQPPRTRTDRDTLEQVGKAAASVRVLTDYLDRHPEALIRGKAKDAQ